MSMLEKIMNALSAEANNALRYFYNTRIPRI